MYVHHVGRRLHKIRIDRFIAKKLRNKLWKIAYISETFVRKVSVIMSVTKRHCQEVDVTLLVLRVDAKHGLSLSSKFTQN